MYPNIPESAVDRTLDLVELGDWRNARIGQLSGGMQRRVALAIALVHGPRLLMLDEPTVGQDPRLRVKFWDEFRRLNRNGVTVVASTHSMDEAERCDELALIDAGRVIAHGSPEELKMSQKVNTLEEAFLNLTEARR
jgi:ABC-2 type transport system ATP-binding protein